MKEEKRTFEKRDWDRRTQPFNKGIGQRKKTFEKWDWDRRTQPFNNGIGQRKKPLKKGIGTEEHMLTLKKGNVKPFGL